MRVIGFNAFMQKSPSLAFLFFLKLLDDVIVFGLNGNSPNTNSNIFSSTLTLYKNQLPMNI